MTNGEMIQKAFDCEVCDPIIEDNIIHVIFADEKDSAIGFDWSWWNAEYKESTTKNDLGVDCISREQALNEFCIYNSYDSIGVDKVRSYLKALPSVTPQEPRKGHWDIKDNMWWVCSACGCQTRMMKKYNVPNFCPACGAKMESGGK